MRHTVLQLKGKFPAIIVASFIFEILLKKRCTPHRINELPQETIFKTCLGRRKLLQ